MCVPERAPALLLLLEYVQFPAIGVTRCPGLSSCRVLLSRSFPLPTILAPRLAVLPGGAATAPYLRCSGPPQGGAPAGIQPMWPITDPRIHEPLCVSYEGPL